ncbi:hypothetical protein MNBD_GAMMA08-1913 [hydrothermal vent metagenome]|uniref:histidine kinase n=1 Tax=hydrothermal vent metagenome TaxID=652676 RepID=A0A3B0X6U5_9ZZZZ
MDIRQVVVSWAHSLSGRVLISILLIHLVLLAALFYSVLKLVENNYTEQFIDDVRTDSLRVSQLIILELESRDLSQLKAFSENLLLGGQLVSIAIRYPNGKSLYLSNASMKSQKNFKEDFFFGDNGDNLYYIKTPLTTKQGEFIGDLQLTYDEVPTLDEIQNLYRNGLIITAIYMLIIIIFTGAVDTYITQPLRDLTKDANRIAAGKYKERFVISTNINEVKLLADSLELMRSELVARGEKLADREKRIAALVDSIADAVIVCNKRGYLESVNSAVTSITGYSIEDLAEENIYSLINFDEVIKRLNKPQSERLYETVAIAKDGKEIPVEVNVSELRQEHKTLMLVLLRDIRERKRSEIERYKYHNDMAHAGRLGIMGEMAAGIAHEINQPLAAINLYLQGCIRRYEREEISKRDVLYAIKSADEQATRAAIIIKKMKSFVRKESENENFEVVDINALIKRSADFILLDPKYSIIEPEFLLTSCTLMAKVDSLQIEQVLVNLIRNAIEAIFFKIVNPYFLKIYSEINSDGYIKVSVIDSGSGVDSKNIDKIFDTYFTTKKNGLGMGLAICRSIIEEHDGVLQYAPGTNSGSIFYFTLPLHT